MEGTNKEKNYFADSFFKTPNKCSSIKRDFSELIKQFFFNLQFFLFIMVNLKLQIVLLYINTAVYYNTTISLV